MRVCIAPLAHLHFISLFPLFHFISISSLSRSLSTPLPPKDAEQQPVLKLGRRARELLDSNTGLPSHPLVPRIPHGDCVCDCVCVCCVCVLCVCVCVCMCVCMCMCVCLSLNA